MFYPGRTDVPERGAPMSMLCAIVKANSDAANAMGVKSFIV